MIFCSNEIYLILIKLIKAGNSIHQFILQINKNQMKIIWHTLNSFGNNKAKRVIL